MGGAGGMYQLVNCVVFAQFEHIGGVIKDKMAGRDFLERLPVITLSKNTVFI